MLSYTQERTLVQRAVIERDMSPVDAYGARTAPDWQQLATIPCRVDWLKGRGARSADRTYVSPDRAVPVDEGVMVVPAGTDVTEQDRITSILRYDSLSSSWVTYTEGLVTIAAVVEQETHMELSIIHAHLGE